VGGEECDKVDKEGKKRHLEEEGCALLERVGHGVDPAKKRRVRTHESE
jgi:hypothetical protein